MTPTARASPEHGRVHSRRKCRLRSMPRGTMSEPHTRCPGGTSRYRSQAARQGRHPPTPTTASAQRTQTTTADSDNHQRHLREAWAPFLFEDEFPGQHQDDSPVLSALRSQSALRKASTHQTPDGQPVHRFQTLLASPTWAPSPATRGASPPVPRSRTSMRSPRPHHSKGSSAGASVSTSPRPGTQKTPA